MSIDAELSLRSVTLLVAVCPTGTAPNVIVSGETWNGPVADPFTTYPHPESAATTRQHTEIAKNPVPEPLSLRSGLRLQALCKLNTNVTSAKLHASEADKRRIVSSASRGIKLC